MINEIRAVKYVQKWPTRMTPIIIYQIIEFSRIPLCISGHFEYTKTTTALRQHSQLATNLECSTTEIHCRDSNNL